MSEFKRVNNIQFNYKETKIDSEDIIFETIVDGEKYPFYADYWEDEIPIYAVLYDKVLKHEKYKLITEVNACAYREYRIRNVANDESKVELFLWLDGRPEVKVRCVFERNDLLDMLKTNLIKASQDVDYLEAMFDQEYYDIVNNDEDKELYNNFLLMLQRQILPDNIYKDIEDYNLANPNNVYCRAKKRLKSRELSKIIGVLKYYLNIRARHCNNLSG